MTINHVVILSFSRKPTDNEKGALLKAAESLQNRIPEIISLECGMNAGISGERDLSFSLIAKFKSAQDYETYANHPVHQEFVKSHIKPLLAENGRRAIQYEV